MWAKSAQLSLILLITCLVTPVANGAAVIGLAGNTCGDWASTNFESLEYRDWLWGYISGAAQYGRYSPDLLKQTSPVALIVWLKGYCQAHPLENLALASDKLLTELSKKRAQ
jgi:hypothetical protein